MKRQASQFQIGFLRDIAARKVTVGFMRQVKNLTAWSVFYQEWAVIRGSGEDAQADLTPSGRALLEEYLNSGSPMRKYDTTRTRRLDDMLYRSRARGK